MESTTLWFTASAVLSLIASLGIATGYIVVAFVVNKTRPDAFGPLFASSLLYTAMVLVGTALGWLMPVMYTRAGTGSMTTYAQMSFAVHGASTLIGVASSVLFMIAIVRLARGANATA